MIGNRRQFVAGMLSLTAPVLIGTECLGNTPFFRNHPLGASVHQADKLADAVGVNTHLNFRKDIWGQTQNWRQPLIDLGARYHRTSLGALVDAKADFLWLWENGGLKGLILASRFSQIDGVGPVFNMKETIKYLNFLREEIGVDKLIGVEGPNEPNHARVSTSGWARRVYDHQKSLYHAVKQILTGLSVVGPSVWRRIPEDYQALADLSDVLDIANLHNYTGGHMPSLGVEGYPLRVTTLRGVMDAARSVAPDAPLWITEYSHNAHHESENWSPWVIPDTVAAKYLLRGIALKFQNGARRIFIYSLLDDAKEGEFYGLLSTSTSHDFMPRPTYYALQRFINILSDPGPAHSPERLFYNLAGNLEDIVSVLLQKRDGTWVLLIWQEVGLWDRVNVSEIRAAARPISLVLPFIASVIAYEPSERDVGVVLTHNSSTVVLSVPAHILALEINQVG